MSSKLYMNVYKSPLFNFPEQPLFGLKGFNIRNDISSPQLSTIKLTGVHQVTYNDFIEVIIKNEKIIGFVTESKIATIKDEFNTQISFNSTPFVFNNFTLENENDYVNDIEFVQYNLITLYSNSLFSFITTVYPNNSTINVTIDNQVSINTNLNVSRDVKTFYDLVGFMIKSGIQFSFKTFKIKDTNAVEIVVTLTDSSLTPAKLNLNNAILKSIVTLYGSEEWNILDATKVDMDGVVLDSGIYYLTLNNDYTSSYSADKNAINRVYPIKPINKVTFTDDISLSNFVQSKFNEISFQNEIIIELPRKNLIYDFSELDALIGQLVEYKDDNYDGVLITSIISAFEVKDSSMIKITLGLSRNKNYAQAILKLIKERS